MAHELEGLTEEELEDVKKRFWKFVDKKGEDDCWEWKGARGGATRSVRKYSASKSKLPGWYGGFKVKGKMHYAHRVAWALSHGAYSQLCVLHKCDTPSCVNPNHLFCGSASENNIDAIKKGRWHNQKLNVCDIVLIRKQLPVMTRAALAKEYNVSLYTIGAIARGFHWGWLKDED